MSLSGYALQHLLVSTFLLLILFVYVPYLYETIHYCVLFNDHTIVQPTRAYFQEKKTSNIIFYFFEKF